MPIYEYACHECEHEFELLVRGSEQPLCPTCGGRRIERQLSVPAAHSGTGLGGLPISQASSGPT